jgi:hypothetical protein
MCSDNLFVNDIWTTVSAIAAAISSLAALFTVYQVNSRKITK